MNANNADNAINANNSNLYTFSSLLAVPAMLALLALFSIPFQLRLNFRYNCLQRLFWFFAVGNYRFLGIFQFVPIKSADWKWRARLGDWQQAEKEFVFRWKEIFSAGQAL